LEGADEKLAASSGEHSQLVEILEALDTDSRLNFTANLPNQGAIPNLPKEAILELTSVGTARGVLPIAVPDFPDLLAAPLIRKIAGQQLTIEAALQGSRGLFIESLLMDGCVNDPDVAVKLADELLAVQAAYLPNFK
jgi:alpha-galactosidase/6-phospho-beta-glucosidase family protein